MTPTAESLVRFACLQTEPRIGARECNIADTVARIDAAAAQGVRLMVLPELCSSGYVFVTREEAFALAEEIPHGIAERAGQRLYSAAVLFGTDGHIGTYRKMHLWAAENLFFEPGDLGRIAMLICYDGWFPEAWRLCGLQGADLVCVPTNWVPIPGQDPQQPAMENVLAMGAAHVNSVFVAAAVRVGTERGQPFLGCSLICSYTGWPAAGPASRTEAETIFADLNLSQGRRKRNWNDFNQILRDRRSDTYDTMLGSGLKPGWF